jgi:hypothetical protein
MFNKFRVHCKVKEVRVFATKHGLQVSNPFNQQQSVQVLIYRTAELDFENGNFSNGVDCCLLEPTGIPKDTACIFTRHCFIFSRLRKGSKK